ncbi:MAG TPA: sensor domain-containing diguanylate cyclase, partial [Candidatus Omnitrophota bacterium]|nr:sensor domain-containing diguanylate cyclase [Candidatus Omnitrophota bacterium]
MDKLTTRESIATYRMLITAQTQRLRFGLQTAYRREEHVIRDQLSQALTTEGITHVSRIALERLGIGGVNVYRYNHESRFLKSMEREALQGGSRYEKAQLIGAGEKNHFINSGLDIMLVDRTKFEGFAADDREQAKSDLESDLKKYFGDNYSSAFAGRIPMLYEALRYNLYVRYPGQGKYDMVIMANLHVSNAQQVKTGKEPLPLFRAPEQQTIVFDTLRGLKTSITSELVKAELMRLDQLQLSRAATTHDLHMALDQVRDHDELFRMLLDALPGQFMRNEKNSYVHRSSVMLYDEDAGVLRIAASRGICDSLVRSAFIKPGESITGTVFNTGKPVLETDTQNSEFFAERDDASKIAKGSFMSVPIKFEGHTYGVLNIRSNHPKAFKPEDLQHLETLASILASKMRLTSLMTMDGLTRVLYQRRWGVEKLNSMFEEAKKKNNALAFIIFDADHFKRINDTYSHGAGDSVLIGIANAIHRYMLAHKDMFRDHVEIRWGGEELVVGLLGVSRKKAIEIADAIREEIKRQKYTFFEEEITVTASAGIAVYP